jgi:hypothetical protein
MEVHHHPDLNHGRKSWKRYLLEGLMIFVAVTLGFFAEQLREHIVEKKHEREYALSLYNDLKTDTAILKRTFLEKAWIRDKYDSALVILENPSNTRNHGYVYYVERYLTNNDVFTSQDITYQQLKNSGGFRYFRNIALYKKLADYYNLYSRYQALDGPFADNNLRNQLTSLESGLFDLKQLNSLDNPVPTSFYDLVLSPGTRNFTPLNNSEKDRNQLYQHIANAKLRSANSMVFLNWLQSLSSELIGELKSEYRLETGTAQ